MHMDEQTNREGKLKRQAKEGHGVHILKNSPRSLHSPKISNFPVSHLGSVLVGFGGGGGGVPGVKKKKIKAEMTAVTRTTPPITL